MPLVSKTKVLTLGSIFDSCVTEPNTGCWLWLEGTDSKGYARSSHNGSRVRVHRLICSWTTNTPMFMLENVFHTCFVKSCCNPAHIYHGDDAELETRRAHRIRERWRGNR